MRKFHVILFLIVISCTAAAQTIPSVRTTDWTLAGFKGSRNVDYTVVNFTDHGGTADGLTPNDAVYASIMDSLAGSPAVIYFPGGTYYFEDGLPLRSHLVLRGDNDGSTQLTFDLGGSGHLLYASGNLTGNAASLTANALTGDTALALAAPGAFAPGDYLYLRSDDDSLVTSAWALGTTGQIIRVETVTGDGVELRSPVRRRHPAAAHAEAVRIDPVHHIGIERLTIHRLDATPNQTSNIRLTWATESWIDCVVSYNSNFGHIELRSCANIDVRDSHMQDAFAYGGGGQGYGVVLHIGTSECLVTGNRFKHLRHSMLLQAGANGNVVSYNYSEDPFWTEVFPLPANSAGDLVLHGNWTYLNLLEGNIVAHMVIDDSHGKNGPYNTLFRNRAELYGIFMNNAPASNMQNIVGNEVTNANPIMGYYVISGTGHFLHGNNINGNIRPSGTGQLPEASLYLDETPDFYSGQSNWPPIGVPNGLGQYGNEAEHLFDQGILTGCDAGIINAPITHLVDRLQIRPNPASTTVSWHTDGTSGIRQIILLSTDGRIARTFDPVPELDLTGLPAGLYLLVAEHRDGSRSTGRVVKVRSAQPVY